MPVTYKWCQADSVSEAIFKDGCGTYKWHHRPTRHFPQ